MKNQLTKLLVFVGLLTAGMAFGQTSLTQTFLKAAQQGGNQGASGLQENFDTTVSLNSATGITVAQNGTPVTYLFIDGELEGVLSTVSGSTTIFNVLRAQEGTKAANHTLGDMVLAQNVSFQFGGGSGSGGFQKTDPPYLGGCTAANTVFTPWVNTNNSYQWICTATTSTAGQWIPGWNNPYPRVLGNDVASAASMTPTSPLFHLTGSTAVTTVGIPIGFNANETDGATTNGKTSGGSFCVIPDNATAVGFTTGNDISISSATFVVSKMECLVWDSKVSKFALNGY